MTTFLKLQTLVFRSFSYASNLISSPSQELSRYVYHNLTQRTSGYKEKLTTIYISINNITFVYYSYLNIILKTENTLYNPLSSHTLS